MITPVPRHRAGVGGFRRPSGVLAALATAAVLLVGAGSSLAAEASPQRVAATTGCQSVGGGSVASGGGPHRATVVVDTGSGPVWSACISFSGSISGIEALERAQSVITDLDPVYDQYAGLGKAVCRLRGVGSDPPDCLGKSTSYWSYSHDGKVAPVGAGSVSVGDGDIEGWRYGSGGTPRAATDGTRATSAAPATTTTRPVTATTRPATPTTAPGTGALTGSTKPDGTPATTVAPKPGDTTTSTAKGTTTTAADGTTTTADGAAVQGAEVEGSAASDDATGSGSGSDDESAAAAGSASAAAAGGDDGSSSGGGSSAASVAGFVAVIALVGAGTVLVRRRRIAADQASLAS